MYYDNMGTITVWYFFVLVLIWTIPSTEAQRSLQQYLQLAGQPYSAIQFPDATQNVAPTYTTNNNMPGNSIKQPVPTGLPIFSAASLPSLIAGLSQPTTEKPPQIQSPSSSNIDAKLLNNLAIALQLLIVNNIINSPPPESLSEKIIEGKQEPVYKPSELTYNSPIQAHYYMPQEQIKSAVNLVTSNYGEQKSAHNCQPSRRSLSLIKSPYEALASSLSYADPIAPYSSLNTRKDLKSPYAMIDKDLFSMNDLF